MSVFARFRSLPLNKLTAAAMSVLLLILSGAANGLFATVEVGATHTDCSDGLDNDGDGKYDYPEDTDCYSLDDELEGPESQGLFLSITDGRDSVSVGDAVIYIIKLRQQRDDLKDVDVDLHLPSQANLVGADQGGRWIDGRVHWDNVTVQKNHITTLTVQVNITPKAKKEKLLVARVIAEGVQATDTTMVKGAAVPGENQKKFSVTVTDNRTYAVPDQTLTYTVTVTNRRDVSDTADVRVGLAAFTYLDTVPAGAESDRDTIVWKNQEFGPKERRTYTFQAKIQKRAHDGVSLFTRAVAGNAAGTDRTTIQRGPPPNDISVSITDNRTTVERGQFLTYNIYLRNKSDYPEVDPWVAAEVSTFAEFISASEGGYWDGSNVRWEGQEIASNGVRTLSYTVRVRSDAPTGSQILGSVIINNQMKADDRTQVADVSREKEVGVQVWKSPEVPLRPRTTEIPEATTNTRGLRISQQADRSEALPGNRIRFTLTVKNGTNTVIDEGATVSVRYDASAMRYVRSAGGDLIVDGHIRWELPRMNPGETWTTTYELQVREDAPHGLRTSTITTVSGGDAGDYGYDGRMDQTNVSVIRDLPTTGAPMDIIAMLGASVSGFAGSGLAFRRVKKWLI